MSDMTPSREWLFYLVDMIAFCKRVQGYTAGVTQDQFLTETMRFDATIRNLELIGEAATHIPEEVRSLSPFVAWRKVIATRNRLIHGYLGIDNDTLWSIVVTDVPVSLEALRQLRSRNQT